MLPEMLRPSFSGHDQLGAPWRALTIKGFGADTSCRGESTSSFDMAFASEAMGIYGWQCRR